jgi:hypothetical protein
MDFSDDRRIAAFQGNSALRQRFLFGYIRALSGRGEAPKQRPSSTAPGAGRERSSASH